MRTNDSATISLHNTSPEHPLDRATTPLSSLSSATPDHVAILHLCPNANGPSSSFTSSTPPPCSSSVLSFSSISSSASQETITLNVIAHQAGGTSGSHHPHLNGHTDMKSKSESQSPHNQVQEKKCTTQDRCMSTSSSGSSSSRYHALCFIKDYIIVKPKEQASSYCFN